MNKIGIIRESRTDDKRAPLAPLNVKYLLNKYPGLIITVQPSKHRCFSDLEYEQSGALLNESLEDCKLILGVKEIEPDLLIYAKTYMFFSHTAKIQSDNSAAAQGTPGMDKKILLKEIQKKKITLIDYENIRDDLGRRYLGFGRFAGIVGCYNSLNLYLKTLGQFSMPRAFELNSYQKMKESISNRDFKNARIIVTGDGRVAKGSLEFLQSTNIRKISPSEFLRNDNNSSSVFCNLTTSDYVINKDKTNFNLKDFIDFPQKYVSLLYKYLPSANMLISSHYWDPKSPQLFDQKEISNYKKLKVIGDITCDINGSIPTTIKSTTIQNPYFYLDTLKFKEVIKKNNNSIAIMAVDNLPSELPNDSSLEFGNGVAKEVLPYLIHKDDGRIKKATITNNGEFLPPYSYVKNYMNS